MRILYLAKHLDAGGITTYILSLASGMKTMGHDVHVASSGGEKEGVFQSKGVILAAMPLDTKFEAGLAVGRSFFKLASYIRENKIELVHSNTRVTQVLGCLLEHHNGTPHVTTCHGFFKRRLARLVFPCWGKKVIAVSEAVREHLVRDLRADPGRVVVIHNGIDSAYFAAGLKKDFGLGPGPVIGIVARLSDIKGHRYLIQAMPAVLARFPSAKLLIVGDGKLKENLLELSERMGLGENVSFVPALEDTRQALCAMDIFVLPSLEEGLGLSLMEAMAAGLAVIGSDIGGIRDLIRHGDNGILVPRKDSRALSQAILGLLADREKMERFGRNAAVFIREDFSVQKMVEGTEEVYKSCV